MQPFEKRFDFLPGPDKFAFVKAAHKKGSRLGHERGLTKIRHGVDHRQHVIKLRFRSPCTDSKRVKLPNLCSEYVLVAHAAVYSQPLPLGNASMASGFTLASITNSTGSMIRAT